jgi:hypothetical protein
MAEFGLSVEHSGAITRDYAPSYLSRRAAVRMVTYHDLPPIRCGSFCTPPTRCSALLVVAEIVLVWRRRHDWSRQKYSSESPLFVCAIPLQIHFYPRKVV